MPASGLAQGKLVRRWRWQALLQVLALPCCWPHAPQELVEGPWQQQNLDVGASLLIPVPASGGAVVVGESVISFIAAGGVRSTAIKPTLVKVSGAACKSGRATLGAVPCLPPSRAVIDIVLPQASHASALLWKSIQVC